MTQPHTQTYTPAAELFAALEGLCRAGRTGVLRIVTRNNHAASFGLETGRIVAMRYRIRRGTEALALLEQIEAGQYSFNEGETLGDDPLLPPSSEILARLLRRSVPAPPTPRPADPAPAQPASAEPATTPSADALSPNTLSPNTPSPAALSPAAKAILEAALAEHIGPMAGIVVRNALATTTDLSGVVAAIRAKIPNANRARQFEDEVRRKLA